MQTFLAFLVKLASIAGDRPLTLSVSPLLAILIVAFLGFLWLHR